MIPEVLPDAIGLARELDLRLVFVDVGSRNGVLELRDIAAWVDAYGFEPNPVEYRKLVSGDTDILRVAGIASPRYRSLSYFPWALGDSPGHAEFYVTRGPGSAGLLEPDMERLGEIVAKGRVYERSMGEDIFAWDEKIEVEVRTIAQVAAEQDFDYVDYLKLDVEGTEYEVLQGAGDLLARTGVVKTEVSFIPVRHGQRLFSEIDLMLRRYGFDLLRYEVAQAHIGYKQRTGPVEYLLEGVPDPHGQALYGDAVYVNRRPADACRATAQALVLLELGYVDEAAHVLATHTEVSAATVERLRTVRHGGAGTRLRMRGHQAVDEAFRVARRILGRG